MNAVATDTRVPPPSLLGLVARHRSFLLYAVIGAAAVVVDLAVFAVLTRQVGSHALVANTTSTFAAMAFSFTANSLLNFKVTDRIALRFLSFLLVTTGGYLVSSVMLMVLINGLGVDSLLAKGITLPVVFLLQFILNKRITFATRTEGNAS